MPPHGPTASFFAGLPGDGVFIFVVGLLVGGLGIYAGARTVTGRTYDWRHRDVRRSRTFGYAVVTALVGTLAWAVLSLVPVVGSLAALVAWVAVIRWRYEVGWLRAGAIGAAAWAASVVVVAALELVGVGVSAVGVPGA
ncbi:hypothetical protein ACFQH6_16265 [Halobacteriaceae archaeon GCM10025711]